MVPGLSRQRVDQRLRLAALPRIPFAEDFLEDAARALGIAHIDVRAREVELRSDLRERLRIDGGGLFGSRRLVVAAHVRADVEIDRRGARLENSGLERRGVRLLDGIAAVERGREIIEVEIEIALASGRDGDRFDRPLEDLGAHGSIFETRREHRRVTVAEYCRAAVLDFSIFLVENLRHSRRGKKIGLDTDLQLLAGIAFGLVGRRRVTEVFRQVLDVVEIEAEIVEVELGRELSGVPALFFADPRAFERRRPAARRARRSGGRGRARSP